MMAPHQESRLFEVLEEIRDLLSEIRDALPSPTVGDATMAAVDRFIKRGEKQG